VRILLPPSEAKTRGGRGTPITARARSHPIDEIRLQTLAALAALVGSPAAAAALQLPPSIAAEALRDNARAATSPTLPAVDRYAGVVYDGLAPSQLSRSARTLANRSLLIFSGLFGVVRGNEGVPIYRVSAKAVLPELGIVGTYWKPHLTALLPALLDGGLIIDLRSTDYSTMWRPSRRDSVASRLVSIRILSRMPDGSAGVISYNSKLAKGKLAAALLERRAAGRRVATVGDVVDAWNAVGGCGAIERDATGIAIDLIS
jgi:cytoplasmic iron level regulating protein YaaA (DUF328/UPF0246 family)